MATLTKDVLVALGVGVAFLLMAFALQLHMPTLAVLPAATSVIFFAARVVRRRRAAESRT